jgi:hypothetical protein
MNESVFKIVRSGKNVKLENRNGITEEFDHVVLAAHADQSLKLLKNPTPDEQEYLGSFKYKKNQAILHSDSTMMPVRRSAWSSWNYMNQDLESDQKEVYVSYWMNRLQNLESELPLFITLCLRGILFLNSDEVFFFF